MRPLCALEEAGDRLDQLRLSVAVDAGDADDLAGAHLERDAAHLLEPALVLDVDVLELEHDLARARRRLVDAEEDVTADHHPREAVLGRALARHRVDLAPAPQHGDAVGDLEHLVQLVADEDDRHALALEALEDPEQLGRLLRREHGRRLVEDEDVRAPVERLQDLDALLLADGDVLDLRVGVDPEPELEREISHPGCEPRRSRGGRRPASAPSRGRCSRRRS